MISALTLIRCSDGEKWMEGRKSTTFRCAKGVTLLETDIHIVTQKREASHVMRAGTFQVVATVYEKS